MSKNRPLVWSEVDLGALRWNLKAIRSTLNQRKTQILAIVKADAYGHGMKAVAEALWREGVDFFGVANIGEAMDLRRVLPRARILVLGGFHRDQIGFFIRKKITPTVSSLEDFQAIEKAVPRESAPFPVHVKVDTGMGRLGVALKDARDFFSFVKDSKRVFVEGVYTHFSHADFKDKRFTQRQIRLFDKIVMEIKAIGIFPRYFHAANSMGLLRFKKAHLNLVRPGIILYGINPLGPRPLPIAVRPVLSLKTCISFLKEVEKGSHVSYGGTYQAPRNTRIATLPVGYSHGYRVGFSNRSSVLIHGQKCPVVGRVTMDQLLVDVGSLPAVRRWDEVTLIGRDRDLEISAVELADLIDTIPYEIVCSIHSRIPRIYKGIR